MGQDRGAGQGEEAVPVLRLRLPGVRVRLPGQGRVDRQILCGAGVRALLFPVILQELWSLQREGREPYRGRQRRGDYL